MKQDDNEFCFCPDFQYESGKCANCGKWIDNPKEFAKSQKRAESFQLLREGECNCGIPLMNLNGVCEKCFRKVSLEDPVKFSKAVSEVVTAAKNDLEKVADTLHQSEVFCTSCGRVLAGSENFCGGCGQKINGSEIHPQSSKDHTKILPSSNKKGNGKVIVGILLTLGLLFLLYPQISKGGNSSGDNLYSPGDDSEGRWVSKCRLINVPNPQYPGDQVPLSERIGTPKYYVEQSCTDVFVP